jgi:hypothetical protein
MKKTILILAYVMALVSCQNEEEILTKDYGGLYWKTVNGSFEKNSEDPFLALSKEDQIGVWDYKLDLFIADNTLNQEQIDAIQATKDFYHEVGSLDGTELQIELLDNFDFETTTILIGTLPNTDDSSNTTTQGCWWCWEVIAITAPCHFEYDGNGQVIGEFQTITVQRRGVFGIHRGAPLAGILVPCGSY